MELIIPVLSGLGILGYNLSNGKNPRQERVRTSISANELPSATNSYNSVYSKEVSAAERELAQAKWIQSRNPASTNVIPPFYNDMQSPGLDSGNRPGCGNLGAAGSSGAGSNPLPFSSGGTILPGVVPGSANSTNSNVNKVMSSPMFNSTGLVSFTGCDSSSGGFANPAKEAFNGGVTPVQGMMMSELSGCSFDSNSTNMVPFFGGSVKQNVDLNKTQSLLDKYTGNDRNIQKNKMEVQPMFQPQKQNIYGTQVSQDRSRFYQSNMKTNLLPLPQIKEAPLPPDHFRGQYKTVDQLRVKPKITNRTAEAVKGLNVAIPATSRNFTQKQYKPDTAYRSGTQHSFVSGNLAPAARLNYTNGAASATENEGRFGSGYTGRTNPGSRQIKVSDLDNVLDEIDTALLSLASDDRRNTDTSAGFRNAGNSQNLKGNSLARCGYQAPGETERETTSSSRLASGRNAVSGSRYRNNQRSRTTNKEGTLYSYTGDATSSVSAPTGSRGVDTKKTSRLLIKNYIRNGQDSHRGVYSTEGFDNSDIRTNREDLANRNNYDLNYKMGNKISSGADDIGSIRSRSDNNRNNRLANRRNVENNSRDFGYDSNHGRTKVSIRKDPIDNDRNSDRMGLEFTQQLMDNEYSHDITGSRAKKRTRIGVR